MAFTVTVWSDYFKEFTLEETVDTFIAAGFSATELSVSHLNKLKERGVKGSDIKAYLDGRGFAMPQGHLSFKGGLCDGARVEELKRELDYFADLDIRNAVLHFNGGNEFDLEKRMELRLESVRILRDYTKNSGVTLCLENLGSVPETHTVQQLNAIIDTLGGGLGICLDTGHLHLTNGRGESNQTHRDFILGAGERLKAMHITENNGKNDVHQMPYSARTGIDWPEVVRAVKDIGYEGLFNLEILGENKCPLPIRYAKLRFIKEMTDYMLTDEFLV